MRIGYISRVRGHSQTLTSSIYLVLDDNSKSSSHNPSAVTTTVSSANAQALESQNAVVSKSDLQIEVSEAADGNESDDSAMIESPVSETPQNEDKTPFD